MEWQEKKEKEWQRDITKASKEKEFLIKKFKKDWGLIPKTEKQIWSHMTME